MMRLILIGWVLLYTAASWAGEPVQPLTRQQAATLVQVEQYHQPTLIALWSLSCNYCKENLTQLAQLQRSSPQLQLISVAAESLSAEHQKLLDEFALRGSRYAYGSEAPEALAFALDPRWHGELPRSLLFDGKGGYRALSGVLSAAQVKELLDL